MKVVVRLVTSVEGPLEEMINIKPTDLPPLPTVAEVVACLANAAFLIESIAHLHGREEALLPTAQQARTLVKRLSPGSN